jgi:hypothetical protein
MWTDPEFQTLSTCAFLNKFSHRLHHQTKLHFRVCMLLLHAAHTEWVTFSGMSFLSLYILLFYLHVHLPVALHNHACICYWFTVSPSWTSELPRVHHPQDLGCTATVVCFPIWSLLPLTFLCLNILPNLWSRNTGGRAQYTQKFTYVFKNLLLVTKKNYDPQLQTGRMFLTYQMAAIPTFMPSGRFKTNTHSNLALVCKVPPPPQREAVKHITHS